MVHPEKKFESTILNKNAAAVKQYRSGQEHEMRVLTDNEVLSVAGGPESDVGSGNG
ncbi:hypothetical protein ACO0K9_08910 [Undibacterium sp. Ji50W]|uniref:hypothetical protein n=1 Tax=Undibacterium sp. Ji50W TaxID=3413041 RepID=UPI003BF33EC7